MRVAYALLGVVWLLIFVALAGGFHFNFGRTSNTSGERTSLITSTTTSMPSSTLSIASPAFETSQPIPSRYTCDGEHVNPQLTISGVPDGAKSLVLIVEDPDVPKQLKPDGVFDHWVLFNVPPETGTISENGSAGVSGVNGAGKNAYAAPCPPVQYEPSEHRYFFKLYALDTILDLSAGSSKAEVERAMVGHVIAEAQLLGRYKRK